jgi:uncharacterized protein YecE (DUF72 family)
MKIGQLTPDELKAVDFTMPLDSPITIETLRGYRSSDFRVSVGCTKWSFKGWVGNLYPAKAKDKEFLTEYAKQFDAIELNTTFYLTPAQHVVDEWRERVSANPDFRFCAKFPQSISHIRKCKNADVATSDFIKKVYSLGTHRGPSFLQMPETFSIKFLPDLLPYLEGLPNDLQTAIELRHKTWYESPETTHAAYSKIKETGTGTVINDNAPRREFMHMILTTPQAFIRFMGYDIESDYTRVDAWVERIAKWKSLGLESVNFFVHTDEDGYAPVLVDYVICKLTEKLNIPLRRPVFQNKDSV